MRRSVVGLLLLLVVSQNARGDEKDATIPVAPQSGYTVTAAPVGIQLYSGPRSDLATPMATNDAPHQKQRPDVRVNEILVVLFEHGLQGPEGEPAPTGSVRPPEKVAVAVTAIEPNGVVKIEGRSRKVVGEEVWERTLTGKVKLQSIGLDHQVRSDDVAELQVKEFAARRDDSTAAQVGRTPEGVMPHPVRQAAAESPVSPKAAELQKKLAELAKLQEEIRQLRRETHTAQQFKVRVQMLEVSLTKMRKKGFEVPSTSSGSLTGVELAGMLSQVATGQSGPYTPPSPNAQAKSVSGAIDWLTENNLGKIMADPVIVVLDGERVSFDTGGEVRLSANDGSRAVEHRPLGTRIDLLATAVGNDRVRLELRTCINEIDHDRTVTYNGAQFPAVSTRQTDTAVEASLGKPTVLTGVIEKRIEAQITSSGRRDETNEVCAMLIATVDAVKTDSSARRQVNAELPK